VRDGTKHRTYSVRLNPLIIILLIPIFLGSGWRITCGERKIGSCSWVRLRGCI
jgi:hypothetical protein